jgi:hypothetical protein
MVSERKLAERLILQEFRRVIDFLMHNAGLTLFDRYFLILLTLFDRYFLILLTLFDRYFHQYPIVQYNIIEKYFTQILIVFKFHLTLRTNVRI